MIPLWIRLHDRCNCCQHLVNTNTIVSCNKAYENENWTKVHTLDRIIEVKETCNEIQNLIDAEFKRIGAMIP